MCVCVCVTGCMWLCVCGFWDDILHGSNRNFIFSPRYITWNAFCIDFWAFLCHPAAYLSVNLWLTLAVMPFGTFYLPSLLHVFLSSTAIKLCHCLHCLPELDEAGGGGWGYLNDLVCSDSTALFHCRSLRLISLMDYEQGNKNIGRQSENDWTPCKGPAGNGLPPDK